MNDWTQEIAKLPWVADPEHTPSDNDGSPCCIIRDANGVDLAEFIDQGRAGLELTIDNPAKRAAHVVACVNALAGLNPAAVGEVVAAAKNVASCALEP